MRGSPILQCHRIYVTDLRYLDIPWKALLTIPSMSPHQLPYKFRSWRGCRREGDGQATSFVPLNEDLREDGPKKSNPEQGRENGCARALCPSASLEISAAGSASRPVEDESNAVAQDNHMGIKDTHEPSGLSLFGMDAISARIGLRLPSVGRDLGVEAALMERLGSLICEGALIEVVDVHKEVRLLLPRRRVSGLQDAGRVFSPLVGVELRPKHRAWRRHTSPRYREELGAGPQLAAYSTRSTCCIGIFFE